MISGLFADRDGDGIPTLIEFALGLNPNLADPAGLPGVAVVNDTGADYLSITFRRRTKAIDLTYLIEASSDLVTWEEVTTVVGAPVDNDDGTESVTVRDSVNFVGSTRRFLRLRVVDSSSQ